MEITKEEMEKMLRFLRSKVYTDKEKIDIIVEQLEEWLMKK